MNNNWFLRRIVFLRRKLNFHCFPFRARASESEGRENAFCENRLTTEEGKIKTKVKSFVKLEAGHAESV
jgi:hypothetical protein